MKKLKTLRQVQVAKICQFFILFIGIFFVLLKDANLSFFIILLTYWLIEWFVPKEYKGTRDPYQKTVFFHQMTPFKENIVINSILFVLLVIIIWLRYQIFP